MGLQECPFWTEEARLDADAVIFSGVNLTVVYDIINAPRCTRSIRPRPFGGFRLLDAHQSLENALFLMGRYRTFSDRNFYIGVVYLFLSVVDFKLAGSILSK
jgi:hypothetical protein